jgi:hypothetical protein
MLYEPLAKLIENNLDQMSRQAAQTVIDRHFRVYVGVEADKIKDRFVPSFKMIAGYLRSGDATEYSNYMRQICQERFKRGYTAEEIEAIGDVIYEIIKLFIEQEFPDSTNDHARARYNRRIEGIRTLIQSTIITTLISTKTRE